MDFSAGVPHMDFGSKTWCPLNTEALDIQGRALVAENDNCHDLHFFIVVLSKLLLISVCEYCTNLGLKLPEAGGCSQCCDFLCWSLYVASWALGHQHLMINVVIIIIIVVIIAPW